PVHNLSDHAAIPTHRHVGERIAHGYMAPDANPATANRTAITAASAPTAGHGDAGLAAAIAAINRSSIFGRFSWTISSDFAIAACSVSTARNRLSCSSLLTTSARICSAWSSLPSGIFLPKTLRGRLGVDFADTRPPPVASHYLRVRSAVRSVHISFSGGANYLPVTCPQHPPMLPTRIPIKQ